MSDDETPAVDEAELRAEAAEMIRRSTTYIKFWRLAARISRDTEGDSITTEKIARKFERKASLEIHWRKALLEDPVGTLTRIKTRKETR